jgi:hypothetical protein
MELDMRMADSNRRLILILALCSFFTSFHHFVFFGLALFFETTFQKN